MKGKTINIFAGYDFKSRYFKKEDFEKAIKDAIKNLQKKLGDKFTLQLIEQQNIESFEFVGEFIRKSLENAAISIFELSDRNPNVTFELGYSLGISKYTFEQDNGYNVIIQNEKISPRDTISDLLGRFIITYDFESDYSNQKSKNKYKNLVKTIEQELKRKFDSLLNDDRFLKRMTWKLYEEDVSVICPYIPPKDQKRFWENAALAEYGDFNSVYETNIFLKSVLGCNVKYFHCKEAQNQAQKDLLYGNLVLIGGPMWNNYIHQFVEEYHIPLKYVWSEDERVEDYIKDTINGKEYHTQGKRNNGKNKKIIVNDFGIFAVLPNPFDEDKVIILINGITSLGGLGVVRAFTESRVSSHNCKLIVENIGLNDYFVVLVESDIRWNEFPHPKKISKSHIFAYSRETNRWRHIK